MFKPTTIRVYLLRAIDSGLNPDQILEGSGVSWSDIDALKPLELDKIAELFGYLARRTPPDFAMTCGDAISIRDFGIVGFTMMSMPTLRDAFQCWTRYALLAGHPLISTITEEGDEWCMNFVPRRLMSSESLRFCMEVSIAGLEPVIPEMTEIPANTLRIDFPFDRPLSTDRYALFGTRNVQFGRACGAYFGKRSDLDRPIRSSDGLVSDIIHQQCDKSLSELTNARSIRDRLEDLMMVSAGTMPSLDEMANALRLSRRSLQRELSQENLSYQQLVKEFRMKQAMVLLSEKRTNIKTIAYLLGYKDAGSFRRAFQEWTGLSIGQWQASQEQRGAPGKRVSIPAENSLHIN